MLRFFVESPLLLPQLGKSVAGYRGINRRQQKMRNTPRGDSMNNQYEHMECCFDAFCKRLLRYEVIDAKREHTRHSQREVSFSELSKAEERQLQYIDEYFPERHIFSVQGTEIQITNGNLVRALTTIASDRRDIVLLFYLQGLSDSDIAVQMGLNRSTVQYRRTRTLKQLQKLMMED